MSGFDSTVALIYLAAATSFVIGLHLMNSPATARRGNAVSAAGMGVAIVTTGVVLVRNDVITAGSVVVLVAGLAVGAVAGLLAARRVQMTEMPQLVSLFNAVGGGAAALIAAGEVIDGRGLHHVAVSFSLPTILDVLIGGLTFSGSLVAAGKLAGRLPGAPVTSAAMRALSLVLAAVAVVGALVILSGHGGGPLLLVVGIAALGLGILLTLPIGGADMPVVISLLNACTGTAVAMAGFVLDNTLLVIAGALVGAAGAILTLLMAEAMNRTLVSIMLGGFGTGDAAVAVGAAGASVRETAADDAALQLAYASKVVMVPGYGLAAAQAQHELVELAAALEAHGVEVSYGIHPVAGRMPGHMNVLLAEADVPYTQLRDLEEINSEFGRTDVVLVVGANDVTNPAARRPGNAVSGMPILDVDHARSVIVIKRSMGHGYAGIENELYADPKTAMLFSDAKAGLRDLRSALSAYVR
jgi:NAD(P) transhydrogenase subunit beta